MFSILILSSFRVSVALATSMVPSDLGAVSAENKNPEGPEPCPPGETIFQGSESQDVIGVPSMISELCLLHPELHDILGPGDSGQLGWTDSLSQGSQKGSQGSECRPRRRNAGLQSSACAHSVLHSACNNKASSAW